MIDAPKGFIKDGNKNRLRAQDIHRIVDTFTRQLEALRYARMVPISEISDPKNYAAPLPQLTKDVETLADRVKGHLKKMGAQP
jgi:type I restriction enzyme M protein